MAHRPALPAIAIALALLAAALVRPAAAESAQPRFQPRPLPLNAGKLFDLGASDVDGDGDLDLFSTNHKYRGSLLAADGTGGFTGALDASGLSATAHVPGFDNLFVAPEVGPKGLYLWVDRDGNTHLRTVGLGGAPTIPFERVSGEIRYPGRTVNVVRARGARVSVSSDGNSRPASSVVSFDAGPNAELVLRARFMDLPFEVSVEPPFPRSRMLLGPRLSHPRRREFSIDLGDRHGVAWADFDGDGATDAYISNGGNRGAVRRFGELTKDELYWGRGDGTFREDIDRIGASKGICRGRYVAPVDFDSDGDLDIFIGCEGLHPVLLMQRKPGRFGHQSQRLPLRRLRGDMYRWLDLDGDLAPELIAVRRRKIDVIGRTPAGNFRRVQSLRSPTQGKHSDTLAIGDVDSDGDPDAFIGSRGGNSVLINRRGRLRVASAARRGLPKRGSASASFVDYDNDGRVDFHAVSQGIFVQRGRARFRSTGELRFGGRAQWASANWLDLDGDGDRDLAAAIKRKGARIVARRYENLTAAGHWLEIDLRGPPGNPQAVGARVEVESPNGTQGGWVGQSEGSRYSTGHYRLYFGLGEHSSARRLTVHWPDGRRTVMSNVFGNRRIEVNHPG